MDYEITDTHCTGESTVDIVYIDGPIESIELASMCLTNKDIELRAINDCRPEFDKLTRGLKEKITQLSCEVRETDVEIQKQIHKHLTHCQTIDENVSSFFLVVNIHYI